MEKNLAFLNEIYEEDLNQAKLSLNEDISQIILEQNSEKYFPLFNKKTATPPIMRLMKKRQTPSTT